MGRCNCRRWGGLIVAQQAYIRRMQLWGLGWSGPIVILLLVSACRSSSTDSPNESAHRPPAASDDYAVVRQRFRTRLVKQAPAPQPWDPVEVPSDARELGFESGNLHLTAWISSDAANHATASRPAVLFLHGGFAFDRGDWVMSQPFRDAGFIVMTPILRGENGQPGSFSAFYDEVDDVLAAADTLAKQPGVDAGHIYVAGHSVGGTLTMLVALTSTRFRAAASVDRMTACASPKRSPHRTAGPSTGGSPASDSRSMTVF